MTTRHRPRIGERAWRLTAALTVVLALSVTLPLVAVAAPSINLSPASGEPGTQVRIRGSGFDLLAVVVDILWDGQKVKTAVNVVGTIDTTIRVPGDAAPGSHEITAKPPGFPGASATFTVVGEEPTTTTTTTTTTSTTTTTTQPTTTSTTTTTTTTAPPGTGSSTTTSTTAPDTSATTTTVPDGNPPTTDTSTTGGTDDTDTTTADTNGSTDTTDGSTDTTDAPEEPTSSTEAGEEGEIAPQAAGPTPDAIDSGRLGRGGRDLQIAAAPGNPPHLAGATLRVSALALSPLVVAPGESFDMVLEFVGAIPGLSTVSLFLGDEQLGEPIAVDNSRVEVTRAIPLLAAGRYKISVVEDDAVLAQTELTVMENPDGDSPTEVVMAGLALLTLSGLGWGLLRRRRNETA